MTLSEASYYFQKTLPLAIISFLLLIIFYLSFKIFSPSLFPPKPKPIFINPIFNKLPPLKFSHRIDYPSGINFILDTIEGEPITATQTAKIFPLNEGSTRFGYIEKIYLIAKTLGFDVEKNKHSLVEKEAVFEDEKRKLSINISNFNFQYQYQFDNEPEIFQNSTLPDDDYIKEKAREFLRLVRYPEELAQGKENIIYLNYDLPTREFYPVEKKEEANAVEIDYYRPDVESFPILTPKYFNSQNYVVMVFKDDQHQFLKAQVKFFEKDNANVGVYPVKTGEQAWQDLVTNKKGNIVSLGKETKEIVIKKMFFGYYDPESYQKYFQPVYVFLGDNGFVAYVSALSEEYLE